MFSLKQNKSQGFTALLNCQVFQKYNTMDFNCIPHAVQYSLMILFWIVLFENEQFFNLLIIVLHVLNHVSYLTCMFKVPMKQPMECWMLRHSVSCKNRQQPITQNVHYAPPQPSNRWVAGADSPWTGLAAYRVKGSYLHLAAVGAHCYFFSNKATFTYQPGDSINHISTVTGLPWRSWRPRRAPVYRCMCICSYNK